MADSDPDRNVDFSTVEEIRKEKIFLENCISEYNEKIHDIDKKISVFKDKVSELIRLTKWLETDDQTKYDERVQAIINADEKNSTEHDEFYDDDELPHELTTVYTNKAVVKGKIYLMEKNLEKISDLKIPNKNIKIDIYCPLCFTHFTRSRPLFVHIKQCALLEHKLLPKTSHQTECDCCEDV